MSEIKVSVEKCDLQYLKKESSSGFDPQLLIDVGNLASKLIERKDEARELYNKLKHEREKVAFDMMRKLNPEALTAVRKEFFMREDNVKLHEFVYITQKHLSEGVEDLKMDLSSGQRNEKRDFAFNMCELFKELDVNGRDSIQWQEFTNFLVKKANILNMHLKEDSLADYSANRCLDTTSHISHRNEITKIIDISALGQLAFLEDRKKQIFLFDSKKGEYLQTQIKTEAPPTALTVVEENHTVVLAAALSNMTMCTYSLDDPNHRKKYKSLSTWVSPGVQMSITYMQKNSILYSGATNGSIYSWRVQERKVKDTLQGHTDMVMSLVTLPKLNYLASASLDKTISIWDTFANQQILKLYGHMKGALSIDYSEEYRLLVSAGFDYEAYIWSPFSNASVYRLKGHHFPLVGCQAVKDTPEIITADSSGVMKLWDIRTFKCVQTISADLTTQESLEDYKLGSFLQCSIPSKGVVADKDSRIYAVAKEFSAFDQTRVVHDATTDESSVLWMDWDKEHMTIITSSERNIMTWDALLGSKTTMINDIWRHEISACCLTESKRKIIVGDVSGAIGIYNLKSGELMKKTPYNNPFPVVALHYNDEKRHFLAGFANGLIMIFDDSGYVHCPKLFDFDISNGHNDLLHLTYNKNDSTVATLTNSSGVVKLWDASAGIFEKDLNICEETEHVVHIQFLLPSSFIVASDSSGNVYVYSYKGIDVSGKIISGFLNQTPMTAEYEIKQKGEVDRPMRAMIPSPLISMTKSETITRQAIGNFSRQLSGLSEILDSEVSKRKNAWQDACDILDPTETEKKINQDYCESEKKWGKISPAKIIGWDEKTMQLYTGDELGDLRSFCLKDIMHDMNRIFDMKDKSKKNLLGSFMSPHHPLSAMPPLPQKGKSYLLGLDSDATTYLGVKFNWLIDAHAACILYCKVLPDGLLTSAADKLVKMWSFTGLPLGVLNQNILGGSPSHSWSLKLDVEPAIARGHVELDKVIQQVHDLVIDTNRPEPEGYNFDGLEPGIDPIPFSQSPLRQRIEKTSAILGIEFSISNTEGEVDDHFDERSILSDLSNATTALTDRSNHSDITSITALKELRHGDNNGSFRDRHQGYSENLMRQKSRKVDEISKSYALKIGIRINAPDPDTKACSALSASLAKDADDQSDKTLADSLVTMRSVEVVDPNSFMYKVSAKKVYFPKSRVGTSSQLNPILVSGHSQSRSKRSEQKTNKIFVTQEAVKATKLSSVAVSIAVIRAKTMKEKCDKYLSFCKFDESLSVSLSPVRSLGPEDMEKLHLMRESRKLRVLAPLSKKENDLFLIRKRV